MRWKLHIIIITIATIAVGIFITSPIIIKPLYDSEVIAYPVNLGHYSEETPTEQMIQILNSNYISDRIIEDFDFYNKYNINKTNPKSVFIAKKTYSNKVSFDPTKFESVVITVKDPVPEDAFLISKQIVKYYNDKVTEMYRKKVREVMDIQETTLEQFSKDISEYEAQLEMLRKEYGVLDYVKQTERITEGYVQALQNGSDKMTLAKIEKMLSNLEEKGGEYMSVQSKLDNARLVYNNTYVNYQKSKKEYEKEITYAQVITEPYIAQKKSYPPRTLIILVMVFSTLLVSLFVVSHFDKEPA